MRAVASQDWTDPKFVLERALLIDSNTSSRNSETPLTISVAPQDPFSSDPVVSWDSATLPAHVLSVVPSGLSDEHGCVCLSTQRNLTTGALLIA